jgi:outer membrane protein TolC
LRRIPVFAIRARRSALFALALLALPFAFGCRSAYEPEPLNEAAAVSHLDRPLESVAVVEPVSLTLPQAQAISILRHPRLERLRAERGFADAADIRVDVRPDPELSLTALWILPDDVLGGVASLSWDLLPSGTRDARRGLAGSLRGTIDARIAAEEWRVAQAARIAWLEVARDQRAIALAERAEMLARETRDFGRSMLERGAATGTDVAVLELALGEAEGDLVARRGALVLSRGRLATALGLPSGQILEPLAEGDPLEPLVARVPEGTDDALLLARLPELRESRADYALAERELEIAHLGALPQLSLGPDAERDSDSTSFGGGGSVTIPIHDGNRVGIAEATTRRRIASLAFEEALFAARAALAQARAAEAAAARSLAVHESSVAPLAEAALDAAQRAIEAGAADLLTLLLARQRALEAQRAELDLRAALAIAAAQLEAAFGPEPAAPGEAP